jgi:hypothetical protein
MESWIKTFEHFLLMAALVVFGMLLVWGQKTVDHAEPSPAPIGTVYNLKARWTSDGRGFSYQYDVTFPNGLVERRDGVGGDIVVDVLDHRKARP